MWKESEDAVAGVAPRAVDVDRIASGPDIRDGFGFDVRAFAVLARFGDFADTDVAAVSNPVCGAEQIDVSPSPVGLIVDAALYAEEIVQNEDGFRRFRGAHDIAFGVGAPRELAFRDHQNALAAGQ